jgi:ATP:corrinoid adenosyltransferase
MVHNNFVVLDEICHWLKLMYLFLRDVVEMQQ